MTKHIAIQHNFTVELGAICLASHIFSSIRIEYAIIYLQRLDTL